MSRYWCELAWLGGDQATPDVVLDVTDGRVSAVESGVSVPPADGERLPGLTVPGMANGHSHAFHRALRGRTHAGSGSFWTWRDQMYELANRLDPDRYHRLARATFAEMVLAGFTSVGEFHYLHHRPDGRQYADPNAMGEAVIAAAAEAGLRITLLDVCYLHGGLDAAGYRELTVDQRRFADASAECWADRAARLPSGPMHRVGAAVHSVRAVDPAAMRIVGAWAHDRGAPVHIHLSEQPAENEQCQVALGRTPTEVLDDVGLLDERLTAVHATHVSASDIARLGSARTTCCLCPTTERDLADGIGPAVALRRAGASLAVGTDSHAMIDPWEELRAVELDERLASLERGHLGASELLTAGTAAGHASLGWPEAGALRVGAFADFVTVALESVRLAGTDPASVLPAVVFSANPADVRHVVVGGRTVVRDGAHVSIDVVAELRSGIAEVGR